MKRIVFAFVVGMISICTSAQKSIYDGTTFEQRIGHGKDSTDSRANYISIFNDYITPKREYNDSTYHLWHKLLTKAPYVDYYFYTSGWMESFLLPLIDKEQDRAIRLMYFEDLMEVEDRLIWDIFKLNQLRRLTNLKYDQNLGDAMVNKAHYYYTVGKKYFNGTPAYNADSAYFYYKMAFETVRKGDVKNSEIIGIYLWENFETSYDLFKTDNEKYEEQFLEDYLDCIGACDKMLIPAYSEKDSVKQQEIFGKYWNYRDTIQKVFMASGAASPETLDAFYGKRLAANRKNAEYLNRAIHFMAENNCTDIEAYYNYCDASYMLKPTYENCIGCALSSKRDNMQKEMIDFFIEAKSLATSPLQRGLVAYQIGVNSNFRKPDGVKKGSPEYSAWLKNTMLAEANFKQVLDVRDAMESNNSIAIRQIPANAAYQIGLAEYRMSQGVSDCDEASRYVRLAMRMQPLIYNAQAQSMLTNIANARAQWAKYDAARANNSAANRKKQEEYQKYLRDKKAEEDFWKGK